jgi:CRISPR/Cas system-associated exonuclease Cas4 (RecB family)
VVDQDLDGKSDRIYRNAELGLSCKPDIVERDRIIEHKSSIVKGKARSGDILYVAAQLLVTEKKEGDLRYANRSFPLRRESAQMQAAMQKVRSIMGQMRRALRLHEAPRGTPTPGKCRACSFRYECPEAAR